MESSPADAAAEGGRGERRRIRLGGHAKPYHIHTDPVCNYTPDADGHAGSVPAVKGERIFRVLYLFSGKKRKSSLAQCLRKWGAKHGIVVDVKEVDICHGPQGNLLARARQKAYCKDVA